jgi:hypothetical protein
MMHSQDKSRINPRNRGRTTRLSVDPDQAADLRRAHARETSDHLLSLAHHLTPESKALIEAVYLHGHTAVELAASQSRARDHVASGPAQRQSVHRGETTDTRTGADQAEHPELTLERAARSMRARIRRLVRRMLRPEFGYVAHQIHTWTPTRQRVARACILHGMPIRAASITLNLSLHTIRRHLDAVQAMYELDRQRIAERLRARSADDTDHVDQGGLGR